MVRVAFRSIQLRTNIQHGGRRKHSAVSRSEKLSAVLISVSAACRSVYVKASVRAYKCIFKTIDCILYRTAWHCRNGNNRQPISSDYGRRRSLWCFRRYGVFKNTNIAFYAENINRHSLNKRFSLDRNRRTVVFHRSGSVRNRVGNKTAVIAYRIVDFRPGRNGHKLSHKACIIAYFSRIATRKKRCNGLHRLFGHYVIRMCHHTGIARPVFFYNRRNNGILRNINDCGIGILRRLLPRCAGNRVAAVGGVIKFKAICCFIGTFRTVNRNLIRIGKLCAFGRKSRRQRLNFIGKLIFTALISVLVYRFCKDVRILFDVEHAGIIEPCGTVIRTVFDSIIRIIRR